MGYDINDLYNIDIVKFLSQDIQLVHYLCVAGVLFVLGITSCLIKNNAIGIIIGIGLILNASILNFMAFWHFLPQGNTPANALNPSGPLASIFIIALVACEVAVALAVLLNFNYNSGSIEVDNANKMKG